MTVIYMKLKYCGYAYGLFERVLKEKQYVGKTNDPAARLFAQFHAPQTNEMKKSIISEIKKQNSRIRVIFATFALGMEVDAPDIRNVIHITPPRVVLSHMCKKVAVLVVQVNCQAQHCIITTRTYQTM